MWLQAFHNLDLRRINYKENMCKGKFNIKCTEIFTTVQAKINNLGQKEGFVYTVNVVQHYVVDAFTFVC